MICFSMTTFFCIFFILRLTIRFLFHKNPSGGSKDDTLFDVAIWLFRVSELNTSRSIKAREGFRNFKCLQSADLSA